MNKTIISWIIRFAVAALFIVSAIAKLYPSPYFAISTFEVKQLYPLGFSADVATYFSRILIGLELALGILLLLPYRLKKWIIPAAILLLAIFTIHLSIETFSKGGNSGNCGCFGSLLPMTPLEAIIKNIIAMALLVFLYFLKIKESAKNHFFRITTVLLSSILGIFMIAPIKATPNYNNNSTSAIPIDTLLNLPNFEKVDTLKVSENANKKSTNDVVAKIKDSTVVKKIKDEPKQTKSGYAKFFNTIDNGKKVLCFFAPGCDHCQEAAKELTELKKKDKNFPDIFIIFMDEEPEKIPAFFDIAKAKYPYTVIDVISFWNELGGNRDTPGVFYIWKGNILKKYDGINDRKFIKSEFSNLVKLDYSKIN